MFHCNSKTIGKLITTFLIITFIPTFSYAQTCVYSTSNGKYCYSVKEINKVNIVTPQGRVSSPKTRQVTSRIVSRELGSYNFDGHGINYEGNGYNFTGGLKYEGGLNYEGFGYNFEGNTYKF